jgi:myo-inositol 2-dehydrogenase/D-chiro-inositol 1-dehydrogenase
MSSTIQTLPVSRRQFLRGGSAAAAFTLIRPGLIRGTTANSTIEIGVIGTGGRGNFITELLNNHGGFKVVACADYFEDRVQAYGDKYGVEEGRRYSTLSGYKRLLEGKLDAVAIESPPFFHPEQAAAAVDAGKHVYLAKPIAVDVPGCLTVQQSGEKAREKQLVFLIDFQTRNNPYYREAAQRTHNGDIGDIVSVEACYHCGRLGKQAEPGTPEARLKNWVFDIALSGDIITEQNIHALDVATWFLDNHPISAYGTGGRKARIDVGDCWDHFAVVFQCPGGRVISFNSTQFNNGWDDIGCRVHGSRGTVDTHYGAGVSIRGDNPYDGGNTSRIFAEGAFNNITDFHRFVTEGHHDNPTIEPSVRSNLTTILGRTAAYHNTVVTWDQMMSANVKVDGRLDDLKA